MKSPIRFIKWATASILFLNVLFISSVVFLDFRPEKNGNDVWAWIQLGAVLLPLFTLLALFPFMKKSKKTPLDVDPRFAPVFIGMPWLRVDTQDSIIASTLTKKRPPRAILFWSLVLFVIFVLIIFALVQVIPVIEDFMAIQM